MKVLLLEDVRGIGRRGEIKEVAEGYGRNFLIARKLAAPATDGSISALKSNQAQRAAHDSARRAKIEEASKGIHGRTLEFFLRTDKGGKTFGSVKPEEIIRAVADEVGMAPDAVTPSDPLKTAGDHALVVSWKEGMKASVTGRVLPQK